LGLPGCAFNQARWKGIRVDQNRKYKLFAAWCFFFVAYLNLLDLACSSCLILRYGTVIETNPVVLFMWNDNPLDFIFYKVAASVLFIVCGLFWRRFKKWCVIVAAPAVIYSYVVGVSLYFLITLPN
jgi:hypothetical protein